MPATRRYSYAGPTHAVVSTPPARKLLKAHRSAVIRTLAPTAPLVRARVLAASVTPLAIAKPASSTAKTIAALAASLGKK